MSLPCKYIQWVKPNEWCVFKIIFMCVFVSCVLKLFSLSPVFLAVGQFVADRHSSMGHRLWPHLQFPSRRSRCCSGDISVPDCSGGIDWCCQTPSSVALLCILLAWETFLQIHFLPLGLGNLLSFQRTLYSTASSLEWGEAVSIKS